MARTLAPRQGLRPRRLGAADEQGARLHQGPGIEPPQAVVLGVRAAGQAELDVFALARHVEAAASQSQSESIRPKFLSMCRGAVPWWIWC